MPVKVFITIDTEEDLWDQYRKKDNPVENVLFIPKLQKLFDRYSAKPTYLVNWPVIKNESSVTILKKIFAAGLCEIGAHCHPWNTPPFEEEFSKANTMLCNLPSGLVQKKLANLSQAIYNKFGYTPLCFRAGRWGIGPNVVRKLATLDFRVDTSITPFVNWNHEGGGDFRNAPTVSYRLSPADLLNETKAGPILEVPPTIGFLQNNFKLLSYFREFILNSALAKFRILGILDKLGLLNFRWLSPELSNGQDMIKLSKCFIKKGHRFLNMSFHSTSLLPGKSPFVKNPRQFDAFLNRIEAFLQFAADQKMVFCPLSAALDSPSDTHGP